MHAVSQQILLTHSPDWHWLGVLHGVPFSPGCVGRGVRVGVLVLTGVLVGVLVFTGVLVGVLVFAGVGGGGGIRVLVGVLVLIGVFVGV